MTTMQKTSTKVEALYHAIGSFVMEEVDFNKLKVSDITQRAGIGKGTAYDYFSSKEELIAKAIVFLSDQMIRENIEALNEYLQYKEKLYYAFELIEKHEQDRNCVMKIISLTASTGNIGIKVQKILEKEENQHANPIAIVKYLVKIGMEEGMLNKNLPEEYMVMVIGSKLLVYMVYLKKNKMAVEKETMKNLVYEGIMRDIGV